ncbi:MAG: ABC transporter permease [Gemmatimonadaceae bacterium]|nr:ABC transporter permease [Gemmatimonadaceae bacterium]
MKIPLIYNVRSVLQRPVSTAFTALGIALVVAVFVAMLALANGFASALTKTGGDDNILVMRKGADSELSSGIAKADVNIISSFPQVAIGSDGKPLVSPETYIVMNIPRVGLDTTAIANVVMRGVSQRAFEVRKNIKITGRTFASGQSEVCVGDKLVPRYRNTALGEKLRFAGREWTVVCHFSAAGSSFESEVWGEAEQFQSAMRGGSSYQSVTFRLKDPAGFDEAKRALQGDQRLQVDAHLESKYYADQSRLLGAMLSFLAIMITSIMSIGAIFGAVNTMYASISSRTPEIAVLLTLGFKPRNVLLSFLAESAVIAFAGGVLGCLFALPINGVVTSTTNWSSFSEIAFAFRVTPMLLLSGLGFAVVMGVVGGFFPARKASRMPVVQALR